MPQRYEIVLTKEDFKFSVAHFTIFAAESAERLHGHNYRVRIQVAGEDTDSLGLLIDLESLKVAVRATCSRLDGMTLLPSLCELLSIDAGEDSLEIDFFGHSYRLPAADVLMLPIVNTSIEELARYLWLQLAPTLEGSAASELAVEVEETAGQGCRFSAALPTSRSGRGAVLAVAEESV